MLELKPDNVRAMGDLVAVAKREGNWEEVKRLQTRMLELEPDNLMAMGDLIAVSKREGNREEVKRLQSRILELKVDGKSIPEVSEEEFKVEKRTEVGNERISELRRMLYSGEIDIGQLGELTDEFNRSTQGIILIAEMCVYFGQEKLALKALKGYQSKNGGLSDKERKAIRVAMEIAKSKQKLKDANKWSPAYYGE